MKQIRLGFTETTLLFVYYMEKILCIEPEIHQLEPIKRSMINWLYTTSGYYDTNVEGNKSGDFTLSASETKVYNKYMETLLKCVSNCDNLMLLFMNYENKYPADNYYKRSFIKYLNPKKQVYINKNVMYPIIANKRVLIVSSFAELVKSQYDTGNCKQIDHEFPNLLNVISYTTPYTFFNYGPDLNIMVTIDRIIRDIEKYKDDFDVAIIAMGAYSALIVSHICDIMSKDACCIGRDLQEFFGIANKGLREYRQKYNIPYSSPECWIMNIPEKFKPKDYLKIEEGCYW